MQPNDRRLFYEDQFFIGQLESRLPAGTMVFQLPHTDFLSDAGRERMLPYDQARALSSFEDIAVVVGCDGRSKSQVGPE